MMHWLPIWSRLFYIKRLHTVSYSFFPQVKFAVDAVSLVVGVGPYVGARYWREVLIAMTLTHHCLLSEPSGLRLVPLSERYSSGSTM